MERKHWPYATKLTISLLLLAFFIYLLARFHEIIIPLILAIVIAYILNPLVNFFQRKIHLPRVITILYTYLLVLILVIGIPYAIISIVGENFETIRINTQQIITNIETGLAHDYVIAGITIHPRALAGQAIGALQGLLQPVIGRTVTLVKDIITSIFWAFFIILVSIYLIKDSTKLEKWFTSHMPPAFLPDYLWLRDEINQIWNAFFRGQVVLSAIVMAIFFVIGMIIGLPFAWVMAFLAGILEFFPSIGHGIWLVTAALLAYFFGSTWIPIPHWGFMLIVIGLHLIFEQVDMNYLIPRIVGSRVHLPPLVVILGIVSGAILAGIIGIPLAAPTIATLRIIGRYIFANLFDMEWTPVSAVEPLPQHGVYWWQRHRKRENPS